MKRHPDLRVLSSDHHNGLVLAKRAHQTAERGDDAAVARAWAQVRAAYETELARHFEIEEVYMAPPLRAAGAEAVVEQLLDEHVALRACLAGEDRAALARFSALLQAHIRFEERELFEAAQRLLDAEALARIGRASTGQAA